MSPRTTRGDARKTTATAHGLFAGARSLLLDPHRDPDWRADEAGVLAEPALDEPSVAGLAEAGREQDEPGRFRSRLGREQHLRLLPAANGRRRRGDDLAQPAVQSA